MSMQSIPPSLKRTSSKENPDAFLLIFNEKTKSYLIMNRVALPQHVCQDEIDLNHGIRFEDESGAPIQGFVLHISMCYCLPTMIYLSLEFFIIGLSEENCILARDKLRVVSKALKENSKGNLLHRLS